MAGPKCYPYEALLLESCLETTEQVKHTSAGPLEGEPATKGEESSELARIMLWNFIVISICRYFPDDESESTVMELTQELSLDFGVRENQTYIFMPPSLIAT